MLDSSGVHSRGELHDAALRLAQGLRERCIGPGSVVSCQLANSWRSVVVDLAVAALGGVVLPFPVGRGDRDMRALLRRSRASVAVASRYYADVDIAELYERIRSEVPDLAHIVVDGPAAPGTSALDDLLTSPALACDTVERIDPDSAVRMLVSSGTEAEPKIVAYSHNALVGGRGQFIARLAPPDGSPMRGMFLVPLGSSFGSCATVGVLVTPSADPWSCSRGTTRRRCSRPLLRTGRPTYSGCPPCSNACSDTRTCRPQTCPRSWPWSVAARSSTPRPWRSACNSWAAPS